MRNFIFIPFLCLMIFTVKASEENQCIYATNALVMLKLKDVTTDFGHRKFSDDFQNKKGDIIVLPNDPEKVSKLRALKKIEHEEKDLKKGMKWYPKYVSQNDCIKIFNEHFNMNSELKGCQQEGAHSYLIQFKTTEKFDIGEKFAKFTEGIGEELSFNCKTLLGNFGKDFFVKNIADSANLKTQGQQCQNLRNYIQGLAKTLSNSYCNRNTVKGRQGLSGDGE